MLEGKIVLLPKCFDETVQKTFILKPDPKFFWIRIIPLCFFLACLSGPYLWIGFVVGGNALIGSLMLGIPLVLVALYMISIHLPGQGNLILTHEGFEVRSWQKSRRHKYRWDEVTGFYLSQFKTTFRYYELYTVKVFFESKKAAKPQQVLSFWKYPLKNEELLILLNDWKRQYAPNPPGVEAPAPLQVDHKLLAPSRLIKQAALHFAASLAVPLVIVVFSIIGWYLFSRTDMVVANNTSTPLSSIRLAALDFFPFKVMRVFHLTEIQPGQQGVISVPHFEGSIIRLSYQMEEKSNCVYAAHTECGWRSGDKIIFEGSGQFTSEFVGCKTKNRQEPDRLIWGDCPFNDERFRAQGFKI